MSEDRSVTATFKVREYNVSITTIGQGTYSGHGVYPYDTNVSLTATPATGYEFGYWLNYNSLGNPSIGLDNNLTANATLSVQGGHALVAVFTPLSYDINVNSTSGGKRSSRPATRPLSFRWQLLPFGHSQPRLQLFRLDGRRQLNRSSYFDQRQHRSLQTDSSRKFVLHRQFHRKPIFAYRGVWNGGGASASPSLPSLRNHSDLVPITATALHGYQFDEWTEANGSLGSLDNYTQLNATVDMSHRASDIKVTALFKPLEYPVNLTAGVGGQVTINPTSGPWKHFSVYPILATPAPGYSFAGWTGDANSTNSLTNGASDANNSLAIVGPVTLAANFALIDFNNSHRRIGKWKHNGKRIVHDQRYSSSHRHTEPRMAFHELVRRHFRLEFEFQRIVIHQPSATPAKRFRTSKLCPQQL